MYSKGLIVVMMDVDIVAVDEDFDVDNELTMSWQWVESCVVSVYGYEDANVDVDPPPILHVGTWWSVMFLLGME